MNGVNNNWDVYWDSLLEDNKLLGKVKELNLFDNEELTKSICYEIYNDYDEYKIKLETIRKEIIEIVEDLPGVHLHTSRVKSLDSLLRKVIEKRHSRAASEADPYSKITGDNYKDILTDLVGIRLIVSYRGKWEFLHNAIIEKFPYWDDLDEYEKVDLIPHCSDKSFIAEIPTAYYAYDDELQLFEGKPVKTELHKKGYRSVHYILSFRNVYVELQTRTIYDEAWSDCDHSYVYKHDENPSFNALLKMSEILNQFTNTANDFGDLMSEIFENHPVKNIDQNIYEADEEVLQVLEKLCNRFNQANQQIQMLRKHVRKKEGESNGR